METNKRGSLGEITIKGSVKFFCFVPSFFARCCCQTQQNVFRVKVKALSQVNVFFDAIECGAWKRSFHLVWKQVPRENRFQHFSPTAIERVNLRELDLCQTDRNDSLVHSTLNSANLLRTSHDLPWQNLRGGCRIGGCRHYIRGPSWHQIQNSYGSRENSPSLNNSACIPD